MCDMHGRAVRAGRRRTIVHGERHYGMPVRSRLPRRVHHALDLFQQSDVSTVSCLQQRASSQTALLHRWLRLLSTRSARPTQLKQSQTKRARPTRRRRRRGPRF